MTKGTGGSLLLAGMVAAGVFAAGAAPLAKDGKAVAAVRTENASHDQIVYAAQELTNWVAKLSGAALPVDPAAGAFMTEIVLGTPETSKAVATFAKKNAADFEKIGDSDGFVIAEEGGILGFGGKTIYIAAKKTKGVMNGVYRFLEKNSDIIWVRQLHAEDGFGTIYGSWTNLENKIERLVDVPSLTEGRSWTGSREAAPYKWMSRLLCTKGVFYNSWLKNNPVPLYMDRTAYFLALTLELVDKYKQTDPDIFPLVRGKRDMGHDHHLCFMNPKTAKLFVEAAVEALEKAPKEVNRAVIGLGDHHAVCTCELCTKPIDCGGGKIVKPEDSNFRATQYALFVNQVNAALAKRMPKIAPIRMFSYIFTAEGPGVPVPAGVDRYCPYVKNHKKPVYDDDVNKVWHDKAESFVKAGMPIHGLYEYYLCHTTPRFYHAISEVAQMDLKYYRERGLKDCYLDAGRDDVRNGEWVFDVSAIEFWTMARLMWDIDIDVAETRREFCRRAYREAAPVMIEYYERLAKNYNEDSAGCFWNDEPVQAAKHYVVEKGLAGWVRETLAKAEAAAVHPGSKELIRRHRARIEDLVAKAEKAPKRVTHTVPQKLEKPDNRPDGAYWKDVPEIWPITRVASQDKGTGKVAFKVAHDRENLYILFTSGRENALKHFRAEKAKGRVGTPEVLKEAFPWDGNPPLEIYFDGKLRDKGSYFMFAAANTEQRFSAIGSSETKEPIDWSVKLDEIDGKLVGLMRYSLTDLGVDISKGNKLGAMFIGTGESWNGGQWHSPTSFQTLMLEMK